MDLSKVNPNDLTLAGFLFFVGIFLATQVWPVIRDKWIPAHLEMIRIKLEHEFEIQKESNVILTGIKETLAKMSAQLDILQDMVILLRQGTPKNE